MKTTPAEFLELISGLIPFISLQLIILSSHTGRKKNVISRIPADPVVSTSFPKVPMGSHCTTDCREALCQKCCLQSCEEKGGAKNLPFLRNILHNADKWEGRNNWEMGNRSSSRLWLISIIKFSCCVGVCLCCLALAPDPHCTPGSVTMVLLTVMCMPCLCPQCHMDFIILKCSCVQSLHDLRLQYLLSDCCREHYWSEIFPHKCFISKTDSSKPPPSHWPTWGQDSQ